MIRVTYADGTIAEAPRTIPSAALATEAELGVNLWSKSPDYNRLDVQFRLAYHTLVKRHGETRSFDEWIDDVDTLDNAAAEDGDDEDEGEDDAAEIPTGGGSPSTGDSPS